MERWDSSVVELARPAAWNFFTRLAFRFVFAYLVIYNAPFPVQYVPYGGYVAMWWLELWKIIVPSVAEMWLGTKITVFPNGSGDTTFNYVQVLCFGVLAMAVCLVWSIVDRRRKAYPCLHEGMTIYLRYVLAASMLGYGFAKVFKSQFQFPGLEKLVGEFGQGSPMGLLWSFMGYSTAYTFIAGAGEVVGALLLLSRRTALMGALLLLGVMGNVMALNFCYDIPVKLYSSHLVFMVLFLILPNAGLMFRFFVLRRATPAADIRPPWRHPVMRWSARGVKAVFVVYLIGATGIGGYQSMKQWGEGKPKPKFYGLYEVETYSRDGVDVPPLLTDAARWRRVIFNSWGGLTVQHMPGTMAWYQLTIDEEKKTLTLATGAPEATPIVLHYTQPETGVFDLEGTVGTVALKTRIRRTDETQIPLVKRGFHWINEYPYNR